MNLKHLFIMTTLILTLIKLNIGCKKQESSPDNMTNGSKLSGSSSNISLSTAKGKLYIKPGTKMKLKVVHVVDADTVYLLSSNGKVRVKGRLAGINAPECHKQKTKTLDGHRSARCKKDDEAWGYNSWKYLQKLIGGKVVEIDCVRKNKKGLCRSGYYNRPLITIYYKNEDVNKKLVASGNAFTYTKYRSQKRWEYCQVEFKARKTKKGLWSLGKSVKQVLSLMSHKTRSWYAKHDYLCKKASK